MKKNNDKKNLNSNVEENNITINKKIENNKLYKKKYSKKEFKTIKKVFNKEVFIYRLLTILFLICLVFVCFKIFTSMIDERSFRAVSHKPYKNISDKEEALFSAYDIINKVSLSNNELSPTNLNISKIFKTVEDDEDKKYVSTNAPVPVLSDDTNIVDNLEVKSSAFQIYEKLQNRYKVYYQYLNNLCNTKPVNVVRQYHYDGYSIIGKYNPEDPTHKIGKRHTWFITNFQNVNIVYKDGDGNILSDDNNIKDIMSMASVYTYYNNPYDTKTFLKYCYDLFDNSYSYVASISEVYYCSGCMHYDDQSIASESSINNITYDKIKTHTNTQKVIPKDKPYKSGFLTRIQNNEYNIVPGDYNTYIEDIFNGDSTDLNYCPGHIDLNLYVTVLTLDASYGLTSIDNNYGNRGINFSNNWHGWDALMKNKARLLSYKDWEKEYGLSVSYVDFVEPLSQEEINYYLSRLDKNTTKNRYAVIETALRSVGRIPYYYGGKTSRFGYENNNFGTKVPSDYKGRCLKGLDCSGWVNWVYATTFNKYIIKSEGTSKLATEGEKITRQDLLPGDIIVRPGIDSHVMMFLEWAPDGQMTVIHENGGVNNVSIGTFDAYYPYYRRIINS